MKRLLQIEIDCGEATCASEPGKFCPFFGTRRLGSDPRCCLFPDEDSASTRLAEGKDGWLRRCEACISGDPEASRRRESGRRIRAVRARVIERCKEPRVREFLHDLAEAERKQRGSLGSGAAWRSKLVDVFGEEGTMDFLRCGVVESLGGEVEFFPELLEELAAGTFTVDRPWRWIKCEPFSKGPHEVVESPLFPEDP